MQTSFFILLGIFVTDDPDEAFQGSDWILMMASVARPKNVIERSSLLKKNVLIFKEHATAINRFASENVKVIVVSNPTNTLAMVCRKFAPRIKQYNLTCMNRIELNRAIGKLQREFSDSKLKPNKLALWGNHSEVLPLI